jgi:hypothetical protein
MGPAALAACDGVLGIGPPAPVDASVADTSAVDSADASTCPCSQCCADSGLLADPSFQCQTSQSVSSPWTFDIGPGADAADDAGSYAGVDINLSNEAGPLAYCGTNDAWIFCYYPCPSDVPLSIRQPVPLKPHTSYTLSAELFFPYPQQGVTLDGFLGALDPSTGGMLGQKSFGGSTTYQHITTTFETADSGNVIVYAGFTPAPSMPAEISLRMDAFSLVENTASDP